MVVLEVKSLPLKKNFLAGCLALAWSSGALCPDVECNLLCSWMCAPVGVGFFVMHLSLDVKCCKLLFPVDIYPRYVCIPCIFTMTWHCYILSSYFNQFVK